MKCPLPTPLLSNGGPVPQPAGSPPPYSPPAAPLQLIHAAKHTCLFCGRTLADAPEMVLVTNRSGVICDRCSDLVAMAVKDERERRAQRLAQLKRSAGIPDQPA